VNFRICPAIGAQAVAEVRQRPSESATIQGFSPPLGDIETEAALAKRRMKRLLNVGEAAAYLGVSSASLRTWSDRGLVPSYRTPGGQRRYSRDDLERFIESMRQPTAAEFAGATGGAT
jgi:excisionase family DNA binding protein